MRRQRICEKRETVKEKESWGKKRGEEEDNKGSSDNPCASASLPQQLANGEEKPNCEQTAKQMYCPQKK